MADRRFEAGFPHYEWSLPSWMRTRAGCIAFSGMPSLWSAVAERSGDTALDFAEVPGNSAAAQITLIQSGVAPLFPLAAALHIKRSFSVVSRKNSDATLNADMGVGIDISFQIRSRMAGCVPEELNPKMKVAMPEGIATTKKLSVKS